MSDPIEKVLNVNDDLKQQWQKKTSYTARLSEAIEKLSGAETFYGGGR